MAAQDQERNTHCYRQNNIMKHPADSKCRMSCKTQRHVTPIVAPSSYTNRHMVAGYVHWMICEQMGL
jgi:hypothetical protein